jgi:hypothetical protein
MVEIMETLGEDIVLLALAPNGRLMLWDRLQFALAASELVRLVASGLVELVDGRIVAVSPEPAAPNDRMLIAALDSIRKNKMPPRVDAWVSGRGQRIVDAYLGALDAAGTIRTERRKMLGLTVATRWYVVDEARQSQARARLDEIAQADGIDEDGEGTSSPEQATLAGLVGAIGLGKKLYPGPAGAAACERLAAAGRLDAMPGVAARVAGDAAFRAIRQAVDTAIHIAVDSALHATDSAVHHSSHDGGGAVGGHH